MKRYSLLCHVLVSSTFCLSCIAAIAASSEVKVFTDELAELHEDSMEFHFNIKRLRNPSPGARQNVFQAMPEYSLGFARNWEFSLQFPTGRYGGNWRSNGVRTELQYVAPHDDDDGAYWGFNAELARNSFVDEGRSTTLEIIPIIGLRTDQWHFVLNPGVTIPFAGETRRISFEPSAKIAYRLTKNDQVGFEHYSELGPIRHFVLRSERYQMLYSVWDRKLGKIDFNIGIGHGRTNASDKSVTKMMVDFPL